jgi:RNA polymerase sigma factor (sigma-70 family)
MSDSDRLQWLVRHIVPFESRARAWLRRHVRSLSGADADDIIQEAYARVWVLEHAAITNPRAYFATIIRNLVSEQVRRARIVPMERMGEIESLQIMSDAPGPEQHARAREELQQLYRILEQLPPQARRAFELCKFEGLTMRQAAEVLGVSDSAVEKLLARALSKIMQAMSEAESVADGGSAGERVNRQR